MNFAVKHFVLIILIVLNLKLILCQKCQKRVKDLKGIKYASEPLILRKLTNLNKFVIKAPTNGQFEFESGEKFYTSCKDNGKLYYVLLIMHFKF
jgi:hypothetical protein